jgi:enoyl-CoA hydratase/carnithine racemase
MREMGSVVRCSDRVVEYAEQAGDFCDTPSRWYVAETAKLAIPQVRRGVLGDARSHWAVAHAASRAVAADILTGRTFSGTEAVRLGLAPQWSSRVGEQWDRVADTERRNQAG